MIRRLTTLLLALGAAGCAPRAEVAPPARPVELARPLPAPEPAQAQQPAPLDPQTAAALVKQLGAGWYGVVYGDEPARAAFLADPAHSEAAVVAALDGFTRECEKGPKDCEPAERSEAQQVIELLAEVAAPTVGATPAVRLLVRLDELGSFDAERALERVLERRFLLRAPKCVAPTKAAIAAADAELDDFFVLEEQKPPRAPTPQERSDLAYFHAAVDGAAGWIGSLATVPGQLLQDDHPDVTLRKNLDAELTAALARGDVEEHAKLAPRYLASLGYPGPVRAQEDAAPGTRGYGDIMRDLARSLEILGRLDEAAALYRLPVPFRGCTMSTLDDELQIRGIIRTSEGPSGDCRRSAAMRLYAVDGIRDETYGVEALEAGGYDVARLYRAALATQGRQDADEVKRRLEGSPHASAGLTRLTRLGAEPWLKDLRALRGYADAAGAAALDTLLDLAEHGSTDAREEALEALAALADDDGTDPCSSTGGRWRFSGDRKVRRLSERCETKLPAADSAALATRLAGFAKDPSPQVREHVAAALGRVASPAGKKALASLAKDTYENGEICRYVGDQPKQCERNFPVRRAAKEGLERLAAAEKNRAAAKSTKKSAKGKSPSALK